MIVQKGASIHKQPGNPNWFASFRIYNAQTNRWQRVFRSTYARNEGQAREICRAWHKAALKAYNGMLSVDAAREIIAQGIGDIFVQANAEAMPSESITAWCDVWLKSKAIELGEGSSTHERYKCIVERFIDGIGAKANRDLSMLQPRDIEQFRNREAKERSVSTANFSVRILRIWLGEAVRQDLIKSNPAKKIDLIESREESKRRAFTLPEIQRILEACADDIEWRGLVLFGLYLGQRLGDLARLTWRAVNMETGEVAFTAKKTGRRINLPLMQPLIDYLAELPSSDNPNAHVFPNAAKHESTSSLSNQFREILVEAGLIEPRVHRTTTAKGRSGPRAISEISFHSLRHSAVTMLKAAGVSDFMAMQIVGHSSSEISRQYSHLSVDDLRRAMAKLPNVSATSTAKRTKK